MLDNEDRKLKSCFLANLTLPWPRENCQYNPKLTSFGSQNRINYLPYVTDSETIKLFSEPLKKAA
jgi:hypothetical protein